MLRTCVDVREYDKLQFAGLALMLEKCKSIFLSISRLRIAQTIENRTALVAQMR